MPASRIIFINRFYWPDEPATAQLLTDLAEALAARRWPVEIITSMSPKSGVPATEERRGVTIHRLPNAAVKPASLWGRSLLFAGFLIKASWFCLKHLHKGDLCVTMTDPPLLGQWLWFVAKLKGAKQVHWLQDIYPEVAVAVMDNSLLRLFLRALIPFRNATWRHSAGCVTLGTDMAAVLLRARIHSDRLHIIPNWAPAGIAPASPELRDAFRRSLDLSGKFVVVYSGNMGRVHEIGALLPLARSLRADPNIVLLLIGDGASRPAIAETVRNEAINNVRFLPPQPREKLSLMLSAADLHLITLRGSCRESVFPSKFYGIAAAARPMVFIGPRHCELARIIEQQGMGACFLPVDTEEMTTYLCTMARSPESCTRQSNAALAFSAAEGRIDHATALWVKALASLQ